MDEIIETIEEREIVRPALLGFTEREEKQKDESIENIERSYNNLSLKYGEKLNRMIASDYVEKVRNIQEQAEEVIIREMSRINNNLELAIKNESDADKDKFPTEGNPYYEAYIAQKEAIKKFAGITQHLMKLKDVSWRTVKKLMELINELKNIDVKMNKVEVENALFKNFHDQMLQLSKDERNSQLERDKRNDELMAKISRHSTMVLRQVDVLMKELEAERKFSRNLAEMLVSTQTSLRALTKEQIAKVQNADKMRENRVEERVEEVEKLRNPEEIVDEFETEKPRSVEKPKPIEPEEEPPPKPVESSRRIGILNTDMTIFETDLKAMANQTPKEIVTLLRKKYGVKHTMNVNGVLKYLKKSVSPEEVEKLWSAVLKEE